MYTLIYTYTYCASAHVVYIYTILISTHLVQCVSTHCIYIFCASTQLNTHTPSKHSLYTCKTHQHRQHSHTLGIHTHDTPAQHTFIQAVKYTHAHTRTHTHTHKYTRTHTQARTHKHTHTHRHVYTLSLTHTYTCKGMEKGFQGLNEAGLETVDGVDCHLACCDDTRCQVCHCVAAYCSVLQLSVCCSVLQRIAVCCSVLRCVASMRCSVLLLTEKSLCIICNKKPIEWQRLVWGGFD